MNGNEWDKLMGLDAMRSDAGRAYYGLRNELEEIEVRALYPEDFADEEPAPSEEDQR